nr:DNA cytosine methyltransferase [Pseudoflavonifractor sp. 524-17]
MFDGIGGFPYAASFYDVRALWASEIVPDCVSVTRRHFPDMAHAGDVTQLHGGKLPPVDIVTFGSPCQGLSLAGQRRGLADERSGLFMEAIRIIDEMREATHGEYPRFALFENVPGALSSAGGRDFAAVLQSFTKTQIPMPDSGRWANAGMVRGRGVDLAWCVYDAQYFGTAQRRRRLFLVCDFAGQCAGEILFVPKSLRGYFEAGGTPRQGLAAFAESRPDTAGGEIAVLNDQGGASPAAERSGLSPTLRSQTHGNLPVIAEPLCMGTGQAHAGILDNQSVTLTAAHERPVLIHPQIAGTLCASGAGLSRPGGMGSEPDLCVASAGFRYKAGSGAGNVGYQAETAPTLIAEQPSGIVSVLPDWELTVRRLTPLETERLMGFPDFWTRCGHDGKPVSDTKRYSMLGNSVAVPCVAYIMQGVRDALREEA